MTKSTPSNASKGQIGKRKTMRPPRQSGSCTPEQTLDSLVNHKPDPLQSALCEFAAAETEVLAWRMMKLAKYGDLSSLERVFFERNPQRPTPVDLGALTSLDDLFDAQRRVLRHVAEGHMTPSDALRVTNMLTELRQTLLDTDLQHQIDELRRRIGDA